MGGRTEGVGRSGGLRGVGEVASGDCLGGEGVRGLLRGSGGCLCKLVGVRCESMMLRC